MLDLADRIIDYESGDLSLYETLELFSSLLTTKVIYQLQGHYQRQLQCFLDNQLLLPDGTILYNKEA